MSRCMDGDVIVTCHPRLGGACRQTGGGHGDITIHTHYILEILITFLRFLICEVTLSNSRLLGTAIFIVIS